MCRAFCYLGDSLDGDCGVDQKWLDEVLRAFAISDIQSYPVG